MYAIPPKVIAVATTKVSTPPDARIRWQPAPCDLDQDGLEELARLDGARS